MSAHYVTVQWNRPKIVYDVVLVGAVAAYVFTFPVLSRMAQPRITADIVQMRAYGSAAFLMLTFILSIGPLARLDRRFNPLLYNRRHFGVLMCGVALTHWWSVAKYYYNWSALDFYEATLRMDTNPFEGSGFPLFGIIALMILVVMALTSHDFWQKTLGPRTWKNLHMLVYVAYICVVCHVAFGALQWETHPAFVALFVGGATVVTTLHIFAARRSTELDNAPHPFVDHEGAKWIDAGPPERIPKQRALPVIPPNGGERIALVRDGDEVSAVHGVCAHQGGPLYEGKVIDGCLTCPWHGWQYQAKDGCSPPPFTETIPTYRLTLKNGRVLVDPKPLPSGTPTEPIVIAEDSSSSEDAPGSPAEEAPA